MDKKQIKNTRHELLFT